MCEDRSRTVFKHDIFNVFGGKKTCVAAEEEEGIEEIFEGLTCKKPQVLVGFRLEADDAVNYTDKLSFLDQTRAFPKQAYPQGADFDSNGGNLPRSLRSASVSKSGPSTSTAGTSAENPEIDPATVEFKKELIDWHFRIVNMCKKSGDC